MIAYLTSIGEPTTAMAEWQLKRLGFQVVVLGEVESWWDKYQRFIKIARQKNEICLRVDADVILNRNVLHICELFTRAGGSVLMAQSYCYDFYRNAVGISSPVFYKPAALEVIARNLDKLNPNRPEATAWRLSQINPRTTTYSGVMGIHGFFQTPEHLERHRQNKIARKQMHEFDFEFAEKMLELEMAL